MSHWTIGKIHIAKAQKKRFLFLNIQNIYLWLKHILVSVTNCFHLTLIPYVTWCDVVWCGVWLLLCWLMSWYFSLSPVQAGQVDLEKITGHHWHLHTLPRNLQLSLKLAEITNEIFFFYADSKTTVSMITNTTAMSPFCKFITGYNKEFNLILSKRN